MSHGERTIIPILKELLYDLTDKSILDLGCGVGEVMYKIVMYSGFEWVHYKGIPKRLIGVDKNEECIKKLNKIKLYDELFCCDLVEFIRSDSYHKFIYDIILVNDVLEHLEVKNTFLLNFLKDIGKLIIITVPYGYTKNKMMVKEFNHHIGWYPKDFINAGYEVKIFYNHNLRRFNKIIDIINIFRLKRNSNKSILAIWRK